MFVIGGGVNGVGIARDAAGRGLSVVLCEKDDLGQHTSSRSGKLIHGGLRYLEYYEFRLVREALIEREVLLESAPHIIWPMRFVLPVNIESRPAWLIRIGLFLYDHIGGRKRLAGTRSIDLRRAPEGDCLRDSLVKAYEYSDCWVDDARLVVLNALDASERSANILTQSACTKAERIDGIWRIQVTDRTSGQKREVRARALVNAAGPWVNDVIDTVAKLSSSRNVRLVKGSHIVVKKFWQGEQAYLVQNNDKRVIFVNPYEEQYALIGTTDIAYSGEASEVSADAEEITYLLDVVNRYFNVELDNEDVIHSFSGVRPLYDDNADNPSAVTRDYSFELDDDGQGRAPLLSVFGGKITTFRKLAAHAMVQLKEYFPGMPGEWTANSHLPGGDIDNADFEGFLSQLMSDKPYLSTPLAEHYARLYGTRAYELLDGIHSESGLGIQFGPKFYEREAVYLMDREWARCADDILERRTKHGLHLGTQQRQHFDQWLSGWRAKVG